MRVGAGDRLGDAGWDEPGRESVLRPVKVYARWSWPGGMCVALVRDKRMDETRKRNALATRLPKKTKKSSQRAGWQVRLASR